MDQNQSAYFTWSSLLTADNCAGADVVLHTRAESVWMLAIFCNQNGKNLRIAILSVESSDADGICACKLPATTPASCAQDKLRDWCKMYSVLHQPLHAKGYVKSKDCPFHRSVDGQG